MELDGLTRPQIGLARRRPFQLSREPPTTTDETLFPLIRPISRVTVALEADSINSRVADRSKLDGR